MSQAIFYIFYEFYMGGEFNKWMKKEPTLQEQKKKKNESSLSPLNLFCEAKAESIS